MKINLPKLIGHRGVKDLAPENTLDSINEAIKLNLKWIEVDVKISKDHKPFLLHDEYLDRTTSGSGLPYKLTYKQIKKLDAGSWFDKKYNQSYPPSLEEVLNLCSDKKIGLNIELKPNKNKEKENIQAIKKLLNKKKFYCEYFFSSFDYFSLKLLRKSMPNSSISLLIDEFDKEDIFEIDKIIELCKSINCFSLGLNLNLISRQIIKICKKNNLFLNVYSNKNINFEKAKKLWDLGVDSIFIDDPRDFN